MDGDTMILHKLGQRKAYLLSVKAMKDLPRVQLPAAVTRRDGRNLLTASPLFKGFQSNRVLNSCRIYAEHGLVLLISQIGKGLGPFVPRVPHNCTKGEPSFKFNCRGRWTENWVAAHSLDSRLYENYQHRAFHLSGAQTSASFHGLL